MDAKSHIHKAVVKPLMNSAAKTGSETEKENIRYIRNESSTQNSWKNINSQRDECKHQDIM